MNWLRIPYFFAIYVVYCLIRLFLYATSIIVIQVIEFFIFSYQLIRYSYLIKDIKYIDFISDEQILLKEKVEEFVNIFTIKGF